MYLRKAIKKLRLSTFDAICGIPCYYCENGPMRKNNL